MVFDAAQAYTGYWTDWSHGKILGQRVTLTSSNAAILIAFIAVFDGFVGNIAWSIVSYAIHQVQANDRPRDGLSLQLQALLRNSNEPLSFSRHTAQLGWRWKGRVPRALLRTVLYSMAGLLFSLSFSAIGILSSQIASTGHVLLIGDACGQYVFPKEIPLAVQSSYSAQLAQLWQLSLSYAQSCYDNPMKTSSHFGLRKQTSPAATDCNFFASPTLNWTIEYPNACPFGDNCNVPDSQVIRLDTGMIDSLGNIGYNQPSENRVSFRKVVTCAPLKTEGFSSNGFVKTPFSGAMRNASVFQYGFNMITPNMYFNTSAEELRWLVENNVTFMYPYSSFESPDVSYDVLAASVFALLPPEPQAYLPDPRISQDSTAPISLIFLSNHVWFAEPVIDPWFNATAPAVLTDNYTFFYSDNPMTVMGCLEQAQICNPNNITAQGEPACTDLDDYWQWVDYPNYTNWGQLPELGFNDVQWEYVNVLSGRLTEATFFNLMAVMGQFPLDAFSYVQSQVQMWSPTLPTNQWQIEVNAWMAATLNYIQRSVLLPLSGPTVDLVDYWQDMPANDSLDLNYCRNQKVNNTAYQSFSVLGLALNFAVGSVIVLVGLTVTDLIPTLQKTSSKKRRAWNADGVAQLQRVAYQGLGVGDWETEDQAIPRTKEYQLLTPPNVFSDAVTPGSDAGASDGPLMAQEYSPFLESQSQSKFQFWKVKMTPGSVRSRGEIVGRRL